MSPLKRAFLIACAFVLLIRGALLWAAFGGPDWLYYSVFAIVPTIVVEMSSGFDIDPPPVHHSPMFYLAALMASIIPYTGLLWMILRRLPRKKQR
jgi:hypothetical protein